MLLCFVRQSIFYVFRLSVYTLGSRNHSTKFVHVHVHAHVGTVHTHAIPFHSIGSNSIGLNWIGFWIGLDWIGLSERTRLCRDVIRYQQCLQFAVYDNLSCTAKAPGDIIFGFFEISDEFDSNLLSFFNNFRLIQIKIPFFTFLHFYPFIFTHRHRFVANIKLNEQCWHMSNPAQVHWKHLNRSEHTHITSPTS